VYFLLEFYLSSFNGVVSVAMYMYCRMQGWLLIDIFSGV